MEGGTQIQAKARTCGRGPTGFSIIELVVVLGVLMILLGLLLPALGRAKNQGLLTAQLSGIQQSAMLIDMFADDSDDLYPFIEGETVGHTSWRWYEPLTAGGLMDAADAERLAQFRMSLCMAFDAKRMVPGNLPGGELIHEPAVKVRRQQTLYPSSKGLMWRNLALIPETEQYPNTWCCLPTRPKGPVAMADGSAVLGSWDEFLPSGEYTFDELSRVGVPVLTTWYGVEGRDR